MTPTTRKPMEPLPWLWSLRHEVFGWELVALQGDNGVVIRRMKRLGDRWVVKGHWRKWRWIEPPNALAPYVNIYEFGFIQLTPLTPLAKAVFDELEAKEDDQCTP